MSSLSSFIDWLAKAQECRLSLNPEQVQSLEQLAIWIAERAYPLGLTNYATAQEVAEGAILPTLSLFRLLPAPLSGLALDLGAGSGVIGFTLALLSPQLRVMLADRRQRSAVFLNLTRLRLNINNARAKQVEAQVLAKESAREFNLVCLRALAPAAQALSLTKPLLTVSGSVAIWHQSEEAAYLDPPPGWERVATAATCLSRLSVSRFRRQQLTA